MKRRSTSPSARTGRAAKFTARPSLNTSPGTTHRRSPTGSMPFAPRSIPTRTPSPRPSRDAPYPVPTGNGSAGCSLSIVQTSPNESAEPRRPNFSASSGRDAPDLLEVAGGAPAFLLSDFAPARNRKTSLPHLPSALLCFGLRLEVFADFGRGRKSERGPLGEHVHPASARRKSAALVAHPNGHLGRHFRIDRPIVELPESLSNSPTAVRRSFSNDLAKCFD